MAGSTDAAQNLFAGAPLLDSEWLALERLGGLAGFGLPGSCLRSQGELAVAQLSAADKRQVAALFAANQTGPTSCGPAPGTPPLMPDAFRYRLTRHGEPNRTTSIEVQEAQVPAALLNCVQDELL